MDKTKAEELKKEIRKNLFAAGKLPNGAEYFETCPTCEGQRTICRESFLDGIFSAELMMCPECRGDGFVEIKT
ncbi:MAG: hypothetical protein JSS81_26440 [Acidobacteria bacterium]|nr:hypothetical protein [Acidobacteriota bacterium]